jgi:outer membrane lipoprotein LolB
VTRRFVAVAAAAAALALGACASAPPADLVAGRLAVKVAATPAQPARNVTSAFELRGDGRRGELTLTSPLGSIVARARWAPGEAWLATSDGGERRFDDLDALSRDALGEALPLQALPSWLRGRPWDGAGSQAAASGFEQLGWQVDLARWPDGVVDVSRQAPPAVSLRARVERQP